MTAADKIKQEQWRREKMRARLASPRTGNVIIGMQYFSPSPFLLFDPGSEGGVTANAVD